MYCPSDVNSGFIELAGPILPQYIDKIKIDSYPLSISFSPRTTPPSMLGNRIDESSDNTCSYRGKKFSLNGGIQICSVTNKNYIFAGQNNPPIAELIMSFAANSPSQSDLAGILLCVPIYDAATPSHAAYLQQIVNPDDYPNTASIQTIFYENSNDTSQVSIAYKTCVEVIANERDGVYTKSIYVVVFPNGIRISQKDYQDLLAQMGGELQEYQLPVSIRDGAYTVKMYKFDDEGNKIPTQFSDGELYTTVISSCSDDFNNRFEYFSKPPLLPTTQFAKDICPYYTTQQYKCVPFNQLQDLSGNYVIPGNKSLETILSEQQLMKDKQLGKTAPKMTTADIEIMVAGIIGGIVALGLAIKVGSWISKNA
jgi:hypothetical protein